MRDPDPCDECGAAPAIAHGICHGCLELAGLGDGWADEPEEDEATDEELAAAESAWENERTREPG